MQALVNTKGEIVKLETKMRGTEVLERREGGNRLFQTQGFPEHSGEGLGTKGRGMGSGLPPARWGSRGLPAFMVSRSEHLF